MPSWRLLQMPTVILMRLLLLLVSIALFPVPAAQAQTMDDVYAAYDAGDYETAKTLAMPLAENGNAKAMTLVGSMHDEGKGFPKNEEIACDWYEKAANLGYISAQNNISICYSTGIGRPRNQDKNLFWTTKAAEQNDTNSMVYLIYQYHETAPDKAAYWGQRAIDAGSGMARFVLWGYDIDYKGKKASFADLYCGFVRVGIMNEPYAVCDD